MFRNLGYVPDVVCPASKLKQLCDTAKHATLCYVNTQVVSLIPYIEPLELELLIIEPAKTLDLQLRIDHSTQTFIFGSTIQYQREETTRCVSILSFSRFFSSSSLSLSLSLPSLSLSLSLSLSFTNN